MTRPPVVMAPNLSQAWLETVHAVLACPEQTAVHAMTVIDDPSTEDAAVRSAAAGLMSSQGYQDIATVANTIFPQAMSASTGSPEELSRRYRDLYPRLRRFDGNGRGTYFGRIVAYPGSDGAVDQLCRLIGTLRREISGTGTMGARYEVALEEPQTLEAGVVLPVQSPARDTARRGFPCLSMLSFQYDAGHLHLLAQYRYEYLIRKGYGNYLGLARLLGYVAQQCDLQVGQLTIVTGKVLVDAARRHVQTHVKL